MKILKFKERLKEAREDESGSGLLSLIGVSLVVTITAGMITSAAIMGVNVTSSRLSAQQADDAAEAGISEAVANISKNACQTSGADPTTGYTYNVYRSAAAVPPTSTNTPELYPGCPVISDKWVMVESKGSGINQASSSSIATYKWQDVDVAVIPQVITGERVSINLASEIDSASGVVGTPHIVNKGAAFSCGLTSKIKANITIHPNANLSSFGDCKIEGNIASAVNLYFTNTLVDGKACTSDTTITPLTVPKDGAITYANSENCALKGSKYGYKPNLTGAIIPTITQCRNAGALIDLVKSQTTSKFIDGTSCGTTLTAFNSTDTKNIELNADITIIARGMEASNLNVKSATDESYNFNIISPSGIEDFANSSCDAAGGFVSLRNSVYEKGVSGIVYSGCNAQITNSNVYGQIYAGQTATINSTKLHYMPITLRGITKNISTNETNKPLVRVF